jgi:hypothetical protein
MKSYKTDFVIPKLWKWFIVDFLGIFKEMRWSYLPPLMVYLAAGVAGFTGIIETFFIKDKLGLSAAFLAGLAFWAGLPWALKMPLGHLVVFLSIYSTVMLLPFIGMFYGLHEWTQTKLGFGARTIAVIDTMADSPMGQVAMVPMLAWIAREAPRSQKATYFAVMAAFTNLALSASNLATEYINKIFVIERAQYDELGMLMIAVTVITLILPISTVLVCNWIFYLSNS